MERSLLWSAFALGCVGWLCGLLLTRGDPAKSDAESRVVARPYLLLAVVLPIVIFLATLPSKPPFAVGQGWGRGFLLGGLGALLAAWTLMRARRSDSQVVRSAALVASVYSVAVAAASIALILLKPVIVDALAGIAIGWFVVSLILYLGWQAGDSAKPIVLASGIGFATTVCAVAALGVYRGATGFEPMRWAATGMAIAACVPFLLLLCALPSNVITGAALRLPGAALFARLSGRLFAGEETRRLVAEGWRLILSVALLLLLAWLLSIKVLTTMHLWHVVGIGLIVSLVAWWLIRDETTRPSSLGMIGLNPLAALLLLGGFMVAFQMLAGFGVGLMLLAAWLVIGVATSAAAEPRAVEAADSSMFAATVGLVRLLLFGTVLLLYRLVSTRYAEDLRGVALTDQYAAFGFLTGAVLPGILAGFQARSSTSSPAGQVLRLVLTGALTLFVPALLLLLWGGKCALALLIGLAFSVIFENDRVSLPRFVPAAVAEFYASSKSTVPQVEPRPAQSDSLLPALLAVAVALALMQWTHHVLPLAALSRAQKIHVLAWVFGILLVVMLGGDYISRLGSRANRQTAPVPQPEGRAQ